MSDLDRFELFVHVAKAESLTGAAQELKMSKAALSKQMKRLETLVKTDLFSRSSYRLQLTEPGKLLLEQCQRLQKELEDTRAICHSFIEEPEGQLKVVAFGYFAEHLIFPKLKRFLEQYPKLRLIIDSSERIPDFSREQVDIAVGFSLAAPLDIVRKRMSTTRYVLCASQNYFSEHGKPSSLADLKQHFYIEHCSRAAQSSIRLQPPHQLKLKPCLLLNRVESMLHCARAGLGLIQLPLYLLEEDLAKGSLVEVLPDYQAANANVYFYYPKHRYVQPKVRKFIDFFLT